MPFEKITKLEAAKRQLITAVDLFFLDGDPISIHTLTSASGQIVEDILKSRKRPSLIEDVVLKFVKDEKRDYVRKKLREPRNFFKHADKEPEGMLEFNPAANDSHLFVTCSSYSLLTGERIPQMVLFECWYLLQYPDLVLDENPFKKKILELHGDAKMSKREYYAMCLPMISQAQTAQGTG